MQQSESPKQKESRRDSPIVLFDGVCSFCNSSVHFLIDRDTPGRLRFAALQSPAGQQLLQQFHLPTDDLNSFVLIEGGASPGQEGRRQRCSTRSTAALRLASYLDWPWPVFTPLLLLPTFLRDWFYDLIAQNRYRWFGKMDACRVPTPELRERFLS